MSHPKEQQLLKIGITIGDPNGIGPELIIKAFADHRMLNFCIPVIYGSGKVISFYKKQLQTPDFNFFTIRDGNPAVGKINLINCWEEEFEIHPGTPSPEAGKYAFRSLEAAAKDLINGKLDALLTAPIDKSTIQNEQFQFPGHTEYLADIAGTKDSLMFLVADKLRVASVTGHVPIKDVAGKITVENILRKLELMKYSLENDYKIVKPKIAVLGLNPHAGDHGLLGREELEIIQPAIEKANETGLLVLGPYGADGFFGMETWRHFDAVLAMYHDQGLIPFKQMAFDHGVNYTAGLPFVRTSPDHGTAYDLAGKGEADEGSFVSALFEAIKIVHNRRDMQLLTENPLKYTPLRRERFRIDF